MPRKSLRSIGEYSRELPKADDGTPVILRRNNTDKTYVLTCGERELGRRCQEVVLQWERPERVFAYLARTWLAGERFPDEG